MAKRKVKIKIAWQTINVCIKFNSSKRCDDLSYS